ncbi:hypothetical protein I4U23_000174 [Adineta vaga]|nr:hypothetical protein I4U23_000174 [Adineta vaga]
MDGFVAILNNVICWLNYITVIPIIVLGTFGNLFNLIIFTRRSLRTNPCSWYFVADSIANLLCVYVVVVVRYLAISWNIEPAATSVFWCKLRAFLMYVSLGLSSWFIVLASIDRYLSSSYDIRLRRLSNLSMARKITLFIVLFMCLIHLHVFIFFDIYDSSGLIGCFITSYPYLMFFNFFHSIFTCLLPIIFMLVFGILTIRNIRHVRNRIGPQANTALNERWRTNDRQLIVMLLFQSLIAIINSIPFACSILYNTIYLYALNRTYSSTHFIIYNFIYNFSRILYYTCPMVGFFVYSLSSQKFRAEMKRCIRVVLKFILTKN